MSELVSTFNMSSLPKRTANTIDKAWNRIFVSPSGGVYVHIDQVREILRYSKAIDMPEIDKRHIVGGQYVKLSYIAYRLHDRLDRPTQGNALVALHYSLNWASMCRRHEGVVALLSGVEANVRAVRSTMKSKRKRLKKVTHDELTNKELGSKVEFAHIMSVREYPGLAGMVWNGLLVNADTHRRIKDSDDAETLEAICRREKWSLAWKSEFEKGYDEYLETESKSCMREISLKGFVDAKDSVFLVELSPSHEGDKLLKGAPV